MTPAEYAKMIGCSPQYIHKVLKDGKKEKLPGVKGVKKYSRFYVLIVKDL